MNKQKIIDGFKNLCKINGYKPGQKQTRVAQYWYLAGIRLASPDRVLPPYIEIIHKCGRSLLTEK